MKCYNHLSLKERELLASGLEQGQSLRAIGEQLGRAHTTLSRELKRNRLYGKRPSLITRPYLPCHAQAKTESRARDQRTQAPLKHPFIFTYVRKHLRDYRWSPEAIAGRLSLEHPEYSIHHETIYRYIYRPEVKRRYRLHRLLPLARTKRRVQDGRSVKRWPKIKGAIPIDFRPEVVNQRSRPGDWETDNLGGKQRDVTALSIDVERVTRYTLLDKLADRTALVKTQSIISGLSPFPQILKKTITADNGSENTHHQQISQSLGMDFYFCHPYHSWEKGTVENTIGRARRFLSKGTSADRVTFEKLEAIQRWLNHSPRKCLDWQTPHEALTDYLTKEGYSTDFLAP